jgi:hypothetical protein
LLAVFLFICEWVFGDIVSLLYFEVICHFLGLFFSPILMFNFFLIPCCYILVFLSFFLLVFLYIIMKLYHQKLIHKWTGIQLTNDKRNKINFKKYNIMTIMWQINKQNVQQLFLDFRVITGTVSYYKLIVIYFRVMGSLCQFVGFVLQIFFILSILITV